MGESTSECPDGTNVQAGAPARARVRLAADRRVSDVAGHDQQQIDPSRDRREEDQDGGEERVASKPRDDLASQQHERGARTPSHHLSPPAPLDAVTASHTRVLSVFGWRFSEQPTTSIIPRTSPMKTSPSANHTTEGTRTIAFDDGAFNVYSVKRIRPGMRRRPKGRAQAHGSARAAARKQE